jgi:hypothetical protein
MTFCRCTAVAALFFLPGFAVAQTDASLAIQGLNGASATLSLSDLAKLPPQTVKTVDHGNPVTFEGVLLSDVLSQVSRPIGEAFHSTVASYYLTVEAKDGYRAVFAWAELDPSFMDKSVYVVTKRDGKLLTDKDGPFQLVAPGEKRAARWVRQVTALRIRKAN